MKIGILTFHCAYNYGAVLQAFALQEFLKGLGHEVEIIDYRPSYLLDTYSIIPAKQKMRQLLRHARSSNEKNFISLGYKNSSPRQKKLRKFIGLAKRLLPWVLWNIICQQRGFKNFISQKLDLSRERFSEGRAPKRRYDAIVFGSDQIWSPQYTWGGDPVFLGDFVTDEKTLKIAYAASAGEATEVIGKDPAFISALKNFDAISVREKNLADLLKQSFEGKIEVVLDPTLLVDKPVWDKIAVLPKRERKYVLIYHAVWTYAPDAYRIACELAEQIDADVISIGARYWGWRKGDLLGETPEQFVGWFKSASCVVTTTFHGTAFSIIHERPFYYVSKGAPGENRSRQILRELGLLDRIVRKDAHPKFSEIDYSNSNARLEILRSASQEFLETALTSKTSVVDSGVFNPSESEAKLATNRKRNFPSQTFHKR